MADRSIRISEAEAASDFAGLLARVRDGVEVVIERNKLPVAVIRPAEPNVAFRIVAPGQETCFYCHP
jgi:antitoxin (DNA-binding transcriptional repressor) of toxin-antitoxin stability system